MKIKNLLGVYFTSYPEYALRYCKSPECLMFCFVILENPFPVVYDDAPTKNNLKLYGKGNYKHYQSHYVPVIPYGDENTTIDFRPPPIGKNLIIKI